MPRYADTYIDGLFRRAQLDGLVELAAIFGGWPGWNERDVRYGLPPPLFAFVESQLWFSQSIRSGTWTYFEATSIERQRALYEALQQFAPPDFADHYRHGMEHWRTEVEMTNLDDWIWKTEQDCIDWHWRLLREHRELCQTLCA
jgi:hypothetical protein